MDFFTICTKEAPGRAGKEGVLEVYPDFVVARSKDLMVRGQAFYAVWDEKLGLWTTDDYEARRVVDEALEAYAADLREKGIPCVVKTMGSFDTNRWNKFRNYMKSLGDNSHQLDAKITFADTEVKQSDYVTRRLAYSMSDAPHPAYDEIMSTLYEPVERAKIEWSIGAIVSGDSTKLHKFLGLYGDPGSGKGTVLDIIEKLFPDYYTTFKAKDLVSRNNSFATAAFKDNPLIAIDYDAKLDRVSDNSQLNTITAHEPLRLNEKFKPEYTTKIITFLIIATNTPIEITDAKSGLLRRLIDAVPTGNLVEEERYQVLMSQIDFELGGIAKHCLDTYRRMGKGYYSTYRPTRMMRKTDEFYNYIQEYFDIFKEQNGTTLTQAWTLYKEYCDDAEIKYRLTRTNFREELTNYFSKFHERHEVNGTWMRSYYEGFKPKIQKPVQKKEAPKPSFVLGETTSLLDEMLSNQFAQYSSDRGIPSSKWSEATTTLSQIDTTLEHFVKVPENHIVIDFDLKGEDGEKSLKRNLEAAAVWPATYAELSKSGRGVHLHYNYDGGDPSTLATGFSDGIEIKVFNGNSSLRRRLTKCNNIPVASISSGLPFKEKKPVLDTKTLRSEKGLRDLIARNLRKEIHPGTKPSIDFIDKILSDAYDKGEFAYDVSDMLPAVMLFAHHSSNRAIECLRIVQGMKFKSKEPSGNSETFVKPADDRLVFFDVEVFPNLFIICWKYQGSDTVVRMINPTAVEVEALFTFKLVGFNNRRYDNHILWARFLGYSLQQLYELSKRIIAKDQTAFFGEAYNLSYADIHDFAFIKQTLKKWEIMLGIHHMELDLPWDEPVPEDLWFKVADYCANDVNATEATFEARKGDFVARQILADLSGLTVNDTNPAHTAKIIFGSASKQQVRDEMVYTDLSLQFPGHKHVSDEGVLWTDGYVYDFGKSTYRGETVGEGGYVYAEPGMYKNVAVLDVASMHPHSIKALNLFGDFTPKFVELMDARLAVKYGDFEAGKSMFGGKLTPYLEAIEAIEDDKERKKASKSLQDALKLAINTVYGLTAATFDSIFRDPRNVDNIVAKRGALFMIDLKNYVQSLGFQVVHIKTDSIKIPDATPEIIKQVEEFGEGYGYTFEHEATYDKLCLVNDAVYIAKKHVPVKHIKPDNEAQILFDVQWDAVGAQFQHPVVYKALFTHEPLDFNDLCETKQVSKGAMYLDFNESEATPSTPFRGMHFVGRSGLFVPVHQSAGGAKLVRVLPDNGKPYSVSGAKDYLWLEAEMIKTLNPELGKWTFDELVGLNGPDVTNIVDVRYYENLVNDAVQTISKFGDFDEFVV